MGARQRRDKNKEKAPKVVWRISASAPLGEYIHSGPETAAEQPPVEVKEPAKDEAPKEVVERGWHHSTHELVHGVEMSEEPLDTLPDDIFDQFVKKAPPSR